MGNSGKLGGNLGVTCSSYISPANNTKYIAERRTGQADEAPDKLGEGNTGHIKHGGG